MSFQNIQAQFEAEFENIQSGLNGKSGSNFNLARQAAFSQFQKLGIPTVKHEDWKYSNLKGLDKLQFNFNPTSELSSNELSTLPFSGLKGISVCFINGKFSAENSSFGNNPKVKVLTLEEAVEHIPETIENHYGKYVDSSKEGLSALNNAMANNGSVIVVDDNYVLETPIIIRYVADVTKENVALNIHNLIVVGKHSEVKIVEIFQSVGKNTAFSNLVTEVFVDKEAIAHYYKIQDENDHSYHVGTTQVNQEDKSYFYSATVTLNGGFVRNNLNLVLNGQYIDNHMYGLYIPNGKQHIDNHTLVDHRMPNCESNELYKGVLMDSSNGVFNGKIFVREDAQKTNAYQNCRNVITSDSATMNTKPQLEIWADDVKCSHGTTTGKLNDEAIFYMQSRGIPKPEAIRLQLVAFAEDVVSQIKIEELREMLDMMIENKLK
jgi:Fe-S cluster assembly protein SufD